MIHRIVSIKNVGRFVDCRVPGNVAFGQTTLVYAENARGKTMLAAVLRSLRSGDPVYLLERCTLGQEGSPEIDIIVDNARMCFDGAKWNRTCGNMEIFDSRFVAENVYAGDTVEHEHKKNLHRFVIGERGVELARQISNLNEKIKEVNSTIRDKEREIAPNARQFALDVESFVSIDDIGNIDRSIQQQQAKVDALLKAEDISAKPSLSTLSLPGLSFQAIQDLLGRELKDVSVDAEGMIRTHIEACMDAQGEGWVQQGMVYIEDERCPFCGTDVSAVELISAYRKYFSDAYAELKQDIVETAEHTRTALSQDKLLSLQGTIDSNRLLWQFWGNYVDAGSADICFEDIRKAWDALQECLTEHFGRKSSSPLEPIAPNNKLRQAITAFEEATSDVERYNGSVETINALIKAKKSEVAEASIADVQRELKRRKAVKARYTDPAKGLCDEYLKLQKQKAGFETDKANARSRLEEYTQEMVPKYRVHVNKYLAKFGADFKIARITEQHLGGTPSVEYSILINKESVELADSEPGTPSPCFKNTLSSGDKSTLAFAFFLAKLDLDPDIASKVVIFDDPISSLDDFRITCSNNAIVHISEQAEQVIVLSHDWRFLKPIWQTVRVGDKSRVKTLRLRRENSESAICEWDIVYETQSEYAKNYCILAEYTKKEQGDLDTVAKLIRLVLEDYLRCKAPLAFTENDLLGTMIAKIRASEEGDESNRLKPLLPELDEINEYSREFHHAGASSAAKDTELKPWVERTLNVIHDVSEHDERN